MKRYASRDGRVRLLVADSRRLTGIATGSVGVILTSPPYWVHGRGRERAERYARDLARGFAREWRRVLADRGDLWLVIGDRHGASAAGWLTREAAALARAEGWVVAVNQPYAGGYIVEHHGRPDAGRHALQLEICRSTYLDSRGEPSAGFDRASRLIARIARDLGMALLPPAALAAE